MTPSEKISQSLERIFAGQLPERLGVAVSGGSDSTALLHLLAAWARKQGVTLMAVTVDHGLRPEAGAEASAVARQCDALAVDHTVLEWRGWDRRGNLQDAARRARYGLIAGWARERGISDVALGHTLDDQAETVLLRLARGSGVDGLSAMAELRDRDGIRWLRPMLGLRRADLRGWLEQAGIGWVDDPSNEDRQFDRVKIREALKLLAPLGIEAEGLAATAARMASAREALTLAAQEAARSLCEIRAGAVFIDVVGLMAQPVELRRRLLVHALRWVASEPYAPRQAALIDLERSIQSGRTATLHGCLIAVAKGRCIVGRELAALAQEICAPGEIWDKRWRMFGPAKSGQEVRALGDKGLETCPDWRQSGVARSVLLASPAVWQGDELIAAPLTGFGTGWRAELIHPENHFVSSLLSH